MLLRRRRLRLLRGLNAALLCGASPAVVERIAGSVRVEERADRPTGRCRLHDQAPPVLLRPDRMLRDEPEKRTETEDGYDPEASLERRDAKLEALPPSSRIVTCGCHRKRRYEPPMRAG